MKTNWTHKVSIIVPAYNAEPYIEECLGSLIRQIYKNIEIIVIDDGSTDLTGKICDIYQQRYESIVKVEHCKHRGVSYARLRGVQKAKGEFAAFVDADDWIEKDYISSMMLCMEGADVVAAGISRELLNEREGIICEYNGILAGKYVTDSERQELYGKMLYCGAPYQFGILPYICNKIFRKEKIQTLLEKIDKHIFDGEDAAIVYQYLLLSHKIVLTDGCKYHYINHGDSASLADSEDAYMNATYLYQELYKCFTKNEHRTVLLMQLDHYMRRMIWKKNPAAYLQVNSFIFPYDKVKKGSEIILYGMGKVGDAFYQQITQTGYCRIAAWADRSPKYTSGAGKAVPIIVPDDIKKYCFDFVVLAIQNKMVTHKISEKLVSEGINRKKIIIPNL